MSDSSKRPRPLPLEFSPPDCSICWLPTEADSDSYYCDRCKASWSPDGRKGRWDDPDLPQCPEIDPDDKNDRCILTEGHDTHGEHSGEFRSFWLEVVHVPEV